LNAASVQAPYLSSLKQSAYFMITVVRPLLLPFILTK